MDKRYDHLENEKKARELWESNSIYAFDEKSEKEIFSIDTPPPTVSGSLHIGHVFSYTHTDIIARFKRMTGRNVFYPMGFDDNGLPTERFVEKKHKIRAHMLKRSEFIDLCLKESATAAESFAELWKKMGLSIDWSKTYSTISDRVRKISQYSFIDLYNQDLVYRKEEPALYCTTCRTSVAQAELESADISSTFNEIEFRLESGEKVVVATTRPELLPACVAVFYHPEDERYAHLEGKKAITPVFHNEVPIIADDSVEKDKGTGLVMCCTFGDQTDIDWYKKHQLPLKQIVGRNGVWSEDTGPLAGLRVQEARKKVLELLQEEGTLLGQKKISHPVSVHERCKREIEYLVLRQWFVNILDHKEKFLDLADQVEWKPAFMKARYIDWVKNLKWDWCISRQRFYAVPFPIWHCDECSKIVLADLKDLPVDPQEQEYPGKDCPHCGSEKLSPETDLMDTWNTSSLTPQVNMNWPEEGAGVSMPMSMRPQAHDIIRTWAFYTIIKAYYHQKTIPWKEIVISGHVKAGKEKLSKSKGGGKLTPEVLLSSYPADAIRYWTAQGKLGTDTALSENQFKIGMRLLTKLWNAFRFCKDQLEEYKPSGEKPALSSLNQWVLHSFSGTFKETLEAFEAYDYTRALEITEKFFWHVFCDNYLELIKDQIFNPEKYDAAELEGTRFVLYEVGFGILQLFSPVIPHVTETLYQMFYQEKEGDLSIHTKVIEQDRYKYSFEESTSLFDLVVDVVGQVRRLKSENGLSLKVEVTTLEVYSSDETQLEKIKKQEAVIAGISQAQEIVYVCGDASDFAIDTSNSSLIIRVNV
jgi:valyl-tRNA synthetase